MVFTKKISDFCSYKIRDPWFKKVWPGRRLVRVGGVPKLTFTKMIIIIWVVVSNIFYFHPYLGKWSNCWLIFFRWVETTNQLWILIMKIFSPLTFKAISSLDGVPKGSCFVQRLIKAVFKFHKSYAPWLFVETKTHKKNNGMFFRNGHLGMKKRWSFTKPKFLGLDKSCHWFLGFLGEYILLAGGFKDFLFSTLPGEMIQFY